MSAQVNASLFMWCAVIRSVDRWSYLQEVCGQQRRSRMDRKEPKRSTCTDLNLHFWSWSCFCHLFTSTHTEYALSNITTLVLFLLCFYFYLAYIELSDLYSSSTSSVFPPPFSVQICQTQLLWYWIINPHPEAPPIPPGGNSVEERGGLEMGWGRIPLPEKMLDHKKKKKLF